MDVNLTKLTFIFMASSVGFVGFLMHAIDDYMPLLIRKTFRYGKFAEKKDHMLVNRLELPKRWFSHFYLFAAPAASISLIIVVNRYFFSGQLPKIVRWLLNFQLGSSRKSLVPAEKCFTAIFLITIQCWKRLYETTRVSVFSNAKINISHYIVGYIHYIGTLTCILGESEGFINASQISFHWSNLTYLDYSCAFGFLSASYLQLLSNYILSNLRKDGKGAVVTKSYKIPRGGLFNYVTGALQFTEITMYFMLTIILWRSSTYHYVFLWVVINQIQTAVDSDRWYRIYFKDYPENRKICIPFIF
ncbi:polyprenol reductase [Fopius arisanus]|uniref:Polyprenal reductase n=1 Tax=Fopius arisanus TaxID=64838 RepID=A0A9R1T6V2_9HYME|nr:PREDICTED: polyprenol reductase [Fopius arisanus]XP_011303976.1 PREDICTED: polyprenol reductase [Fopius arisanus]XP_011303977.1 PREDICTED: polyprenol reductase [Fopius arisanus]